MTSLRIISANLAALAFTISMIEPAAGEPVANYHAYRTRSSQTTKTQPWATFSNDAYGYSIQYPASARVSSPARSVASFTFDESFDRPDGSTVADNLTFVIRVHDNPARVSARHWAQSH